MSTLPLIEAISPRPTHAELRHRLDATALQRLRTASLAACIFSVLGILYFVTAQPDVAPLLGAVTVVGAAAALGIWRAVVRNKIPRAWASALGSGLWAIGMAINVIGYALTADRAFVVFTAVLVIACALIHLFRRWLLRCAVFGIAIWMPVGFATSGRAFLLDAVALVATWTIAIVVHEVIVRYLVNLEAMRLRELAHRRERDRLTDQLDHSQRLEAVGTLAGGVAHDMNNVLATIVGLAELLREEVSDAQREDIDQILESAHRGAELTHNLLGFARRDRSQRVAVRIAPLVESVIKLMRRTMPKGVNIETGGLSDEILDGDAAQLSQALINLCVNASDAMDGKGLLRIELRREELDGERARTLGVHAGSYAMISVTDNGCGMSAEAQARAFDPFFTTKPRGRGTGLGLAMVYGTVKRHDGAVVIESERGRGTTITMYFPISASPADSPAVGEPVRSRHHTGRVLVVDDDDAVRSSFCRLLERAGYDVLGASHGREALEVYARRSGEIDVVVLDMGMPVMGGAECFEGLMALDPSVRVVIASGYATESDAQRSLACGALVVLEKPFASQRLLDAVLDAIRGPRPPVSARRGSSRAMTTPY